MALGNTSESSTITPHSDPIFRTPAGARPKLDAFKPARARCYPVLAEV
jgi:hypothetical protein